MSIDLAAAYGYGLAKNHPFDGNKRVAFPVMATFLEVNKYSLDVPEMDVVVMMERLTTDQESQNAIDGTSRYANAKWLEANVGTSFDDPY
ncbi:Fic family protein [Moorena sp. SIOASIH]|uniref:type II toxin-antitoxin system death-on-curing family toxin n=1 Tax=Moorena sp. SIOASIH TaxID=2607817 RepID=UPI00344F1C3C